MLIISCFAFLFSVSTHCLFFALLIIIFLMLLLPLSLFLSQRWIRFHYTSTVLFVVLVTAARAALISQDAFPNQHQSLTPDGVSPLFIHHSSSFRQRAKEEGPPPTSADEGQRKCSTREFWRSCHSSFPSAHSSLLSLFVFVALSVSRSPCWSQSQSQKQGCYVILLDSLNIDLSFFARDAEPVVHASIGH